MRTRAAEHRFVRQEADCAVIVAAALTHTRPTARLKTAEREDKRVKKLKSLYRTSGVIFFIDYCTAIREHIERVVRGERDTVLSA